MPYYMLWHGVLFCRRRRWYKINPAFGKRLDVFWGRIVRNCESPRHVKSRQRCLHKVSQNIQFSVISVFPGKVACLQCLRCRRSIHAWPVPGLAYKLRYIVGFGFVEMCHLDQFEAYDISYLIQLAIYVDMISQRTWDISIVVKMKWIGL